MGQITKLLAAIANEIGTGVGTAASGVATVTGTFAATGQSAAFTPISGRDFNISLGTPGTALGDTVVLERSFNSGSTWAAVTYPDGTVVSWTVGINTSWSDDEASVQYRLNCTAWTTSVAYRISQ